MASSIVDIKNMGDALRNTGYKNIESAVAEIIDNSEEANAKNAFVILGEYVDPSSGRKVVHEIGFLDDGDGMDTNILGSCLGIGSSTRFARRGLGRFGVGLPQASLYACPNVIVYSWQNGVQNSQKVFLDINKVKSGEQTEIADPINEPIPEKYQQYIHYQTPTKSFDFSKSGTLVIWANCDRISPKTRGPLTERLEFALGQKFRHFIHNSEFNIKIIAHENQDAAVDVAPNDPLFLMEDNYVLCNEENPAQIYKGVKGDHLEPAFELYGEVVVPIKYIDKNGNVSTANVTIRFSKVKAKFYDETAFPTGNPGSYPFGKYASKMEGISVVRAKREIDFRQFDFYSTTNEPQHRWWGCEIMFDPILDEAFGVANNKQYVELKRIESEDIDYEEEVQPVWCQLYEVVYNTIKEMYRLNEETRRNTRSYDDADTPATNIINSVESENIDVDESDAGDEEEVIDPASDEAISAGKEELANQGYENPTDEQATRFISNKVNFDYADKGERAPAFDYKFVLSTTIITINTSHKFYTLLLEKIYPNTEARTTFELLLASLVQSIRKTDTTQKQENDKLVTLWYNRLNNYISELANPKNAN
jgi:hypothetical protein